LQWFITRIRTRIAFVGILLLLNRMVMRVCVDECSQPPLRMREVRKPR
jgi:hypothetical protein